ncbi:MAG: cell division protein ZapA [Oscillospiraceae bacterium]|nr:cell division protein ZapA [Oscillospiraceae bacterium]
MTKNKTGVYICKKKYTLESEESSDFIMGIARMVDKKFDEICKRDGNISILDAAILVSLETMSESSKISRSTDNIRRQLKAYAEESAKLRYKLDKCDKQIKDLLTKNKKLSTELEMLKLRDNISDLEKGK